MSAPQAEKVVETNSRYSQTEDADLDRALQVLRERGMDNQSIEKLCRELEGLDDKTVSKIGRGGNPHGRGQSGRVCAPQSNTENDAQRKAALMQHWQGLGLYPTGSSLQRHADEEAWFASGASTTYPWTSWMPPDAAYLSPQVVTAADTQVKAPHRINIAPGPIPGWGMETLREELYSSNKVFWQHAASRENMSTSDGWRRYLCKEDPKFPRDLPFTPQPN